MLTSACSLLLFIELRERGLLRGYGFDLLKSWEERGEFSIIYQEITRCHHFESMILVQDRSLKFLQDIDFKALISYLVPNQVPAPKRVKIPTDCARTALKHSLECASFRLFD